MVNLKNTRDVSSNGVKLLVYGEAGAGKTRLNATLKDNVILSAEAGLLSLHSYDIPYIEIKSLDDLRNAYKWALESEEARQFQTISLDSISEIAECVLAEELKKSKDGRKAYGELNQTVSELIRAFRDLSGKNVYFSAKVEKTQNDEGEIIYAPSMPGKSLTQNLPYFFDEVFALRIFKSEEGIKRALLTSPDGLWTAKDRSGKLEQWMKADLNEVMEVING